MAVISSIDLNYAPINAIIYKLWTLGVKTITKQHKKQRQPSSCFEDVGDTSSAGFVDLEEEILLLLLQLAAALLTKMTLKYSRHRHNYWVTVAL